MDRDTEALPLLEHRDFVRALARRLVADEHRAEDVAQQAWVVALERSAAIPPVVKLRGWLAGIVRNLSRKSELRERERPAVERRAARNELQDEGRAAAEFELFHRLSQALRGLPEPYKTTLHLRYYQGLAPGAIAAREGVPPHTVKTRLRRGLALLRAELDARHGGQRAVWAVPLAGFVERSLSIGAAGSAAGLVAGIVQGVLTMKLVAWTLVSVTALGAIYWIAPEPSHGAEPARPAELAGGPAPTAAAAPAQVAPLQNVPRDARAPVADEPAPRPPPPAAARARVVTLRITDDRGAALAGARVSLGAAVPEQATDAAGLAALELAHAAAGTVTELELCVQATGYLPLVEQVALAPSASQDLGTFALVRAGRIEGRVVDAAGLGAAEALVLVADPGELPFPWVYSAPAGRGGATARSRDDGTFVLDAVRPGAFRVWAGDGGSSSGCSGIVRVVAGEVLRGVEVQLEPRPGSDEICGIVALPPGVEPGGLMVWARHGPEDATRTRTTPVGANGRFRVHVEQLEPHDLWVSEQPAAWDEHRHVFVGEHTLAGWRGVVAEDVAPGTQDVVLAFEEAPGIELRVGDQAGRPIDPFDLLVVTFDGRDLSYQVPWRSTARPGERVSVPASGFQLSIAAEGFDAATFGPYTPASAPARLDVTLAPLPAVRGRVLAAGAPLAGARVELYRLAGPNQRVVARGMLLRTSSAPAASGTSDGDGAFALTLRESGRFLLRASAAGWAAGVVDTVEIDHTRGTQGLAVELTQGGAIEGQVLLPPGTSPAGWIVGATRGDPYGERRVLSEDGRFRFEGLTPGAWWVGRLAQDLESTTIQSSAEPVVWEGTCSVRAGETTRCNLDFRDAARCTLRGRLTTGKGVQRSWSAMLKTLPDGARSGLMGAETVDSVSVAGDGGFELVAERPGAYVMELRDTGGDARLIVLRAFELGPGVETWEHALDFATVTGRLALPDTDAEETLCGFLVDDGRGTVSVGRLDPAPDGTLAPTLVPAGRGRVVCTPFPPASRDPREWPSLAELTLAPGETAALGGE